MATNYAYTLRITDEEAKFLKIKLEEPINKLHPPSLPWEVIWSGGELYFIPKQIIKSQQEFQWLLKPNFEWTAEIKSPVWFSMEGDCLVPGDYCIKHLEYLGPIRCLRLRRHKEYIGEFGVLIWNSKTKDMRSTR